MSSDPQPTYYSNAHQQQQNYYMQPNNGMDPSQYQMIRQPSQFNQQPRLAYVNAQMPNAYGGYYPAQPFMTQTQFVGPRGMTQQFIPAVIRPPNENLGNQQNYLPQNVYQYPQGTPTPPMYSTQFFPSNFQMPQGYVPLQAQSLPPQSMPTQPTPYPLPATGPQTQPIYSAPPPTHQPVIDSSNVSTSAPTSHVYQPPQPQQQQPPPPPPPQPQPAEKRAKKPLAIVDPVSHKAVELPNSTPTTTTTTETVTVTDSAPPPSKTQVQTDFRQQMAKAISSDNPPAPPPPSSSSTANDDPPGAAPTKPASESVPPISSSASSSRSKSPVNDSQPSVPGIRTRTLTDENESIEPVIKSTSDESNSTPTLPSLPTAASLDYETPLPTPSPATGAAPNQRLRYDRQELLRIRDSSSSFPVPELPNLDIVVNNTGNRRVQPYGGTNSSQGGRGFNRQSSMSNHPSLNRYSTNSVTDSKQRNKPAIYLTNEPDFGNRVENPYKPIDQSKVDASHKVLRDCKAILNKVTPQTYEKLLKQLEALEIDRYERLEGMINIFFSKAVDEPGFSFLYAKICKQFQKKQVTVPSEDGKTVTHYFRQILLTRCQKEFENDYRQEIEYEKRKAEVESIADEKKQKEETEKLDEDLAKAKRRKLGNIFFIGELFKLQMLTDTIMYDCIEYLLRDKTDEEALECLCRLLKTIGKELDIKANEKQSNKQNLEKQYRELDMIIKECKTSARIRFMIQDLVELRQANWVPRRIDAKPMTIDEIHEQERLKREQQERDQERERKERRDPNRNIVIGSNYMNSNQQYTDSRGSRGSGIKQPNNRNDEERSENRFSVNSLRQQLQSNDKRGQMAMNLAPQRTWAKGSGIEKKPEEDRSSFAARTANKPPAGPVQNLKGKLSTSQSISGYPLQRQSSRELARENSQRDRENALQSLRKTTTNAGGSSPSMNNSRESSRNVSREQSRNASRESSVSLSTQISRSSTTVINADPSNTTFDEEKTKARVHSLIEEYTENYSEMTDRPVKEALEDLAAFRTPSVDQQALIVQELFRNVLEAKARARKAVGHLLDAALNEELLSTDAFLSGLKTIVDDAPDYAVDIPLIWQYIGEILGAFIGAPTSNMCLLKSIFQFVQDDKSKAMFQYIIRFASEFATGNRNRLQRFWQSSGLRFDDLVKSDDDISDEYQWLYDTPEVDPSTKDTHQPRADPELVKLFKSVNDQGLTVSDTDIISYIKRNMDAKEKFYIRNIVLSYLEACLINRDPQKKIQEDIAKKRMTILNAIIEHKSEAEIQAVYAIQNFVNKLEHPPKMARLLFDIFYDEECVSEDAFFEWLKHPDQSETEGHAVVEMSTKDFFTWLQQAETEVEEGEEEEGN